MAAKINGLMVLFAVPRRQAAILSLLVSSHITNYSMRQKSTPSLGFEPYLCCRASVQRGTKSEIRNGRKIKNEFRERKEAVSRDTVFD